MMRRPDWAVQAGLIDAPPLKLRGAAIRCHRVMPNLPLPANPVGRTRRSATDCSELHQAAVDQLLEPNSMADGYIDDRGMSCIPKIRSPSPMRPLALCWGFFRPRQLWCSRHQGQNENLDAFAKIHSRTNYRDHRTHYYFADALASSGRESTRIATKSPRHRRLSARRRARRVERGARIAAGRDRSHPAVSLEPEQCIKWARTKINRRSPGKRKS